jgi:hypothetical protein
MKKANAQNSRPNKSEAITEFLKGLLAQGPVGVPEIEDMARAAGHLGKRQSITRSKPFQAAKKALGIRSIRAGFATAGRWCWHLPENGATSHPSSADAKSTGRILALLRDLVKDDRPAIIAVFTIRSDNYERLQLAPELEGLRQEMLSLPPMRKVPCFHNRLGHLGLIGVPEPSL